MTTVWLSYRIQELREHLGSPLIFDGVRAHVTLILCFLCCVILHIFFYEWRRIT
jgi:GAF domain-containing protein